MRSELEIRLVPYWNVNNLERIKNTLENELD